MAAAVNARGASVEVVAVKPLFETQRARGAQVRRTSSSSTAAARCGRRTICRRSARWRRRPSPTCSSGCRPTQQHACARSR